MENIKVKILKFIAMLHTVFGAFMFFSMSVFADVTFDQAQAQKDIKELLDPLSSTLLWAAPLIVVVATLSSLVHWSMKDEEEKENMPYIKVAKKYLIALVVVGFLCGMFKWFTIS